jgi:branched-chain amino acid transport system substrate-binding protein
MKRTALAAGGLIAALMAQPALAQKTYDPGASDTTIKLGETGPYSGPVSAASAFSKSLGAYFDKVNAEGGVNGRKIDYISLDDGYSPPKTVELTRRLVESDQVLAIVGSVGTPPQLAVRKYLNERKVPQLFLGTGASLFYDAKQSPWSIGGSTSYVEEARLLAKHLAEVMPGAGTRIAVLMQNDDFGKDFMAGFKEALPGTFTIAAVASYETSDPTVSSQIIQLKDSGAGMLMLFATQKFAAQAIRGARDAGWKAKIFVPSVISSIGAVMMPAGIENATGVLTSAIAKDPYDPRLADDKDMIQFYDWFKKFNTKVDMKDSQSATGAFVDGALMVTALKAAGDTLTRENLMRQVMTMKGLHAPMMLDGITVNTSPTDYTLYKQMQFQIFNGTSWDKVGGIVSE